MSKKLLKQNFTRCEKCGKSISKKVDSSHNCKYLYFNYRAINGITENSDRNISIKRQFNLNDNSIISPILKIEIDKYLTENPIREVPIHSKIILAENQNLSTKDLSEVFQPPTLSELLSSDDFIFTFGKFKNKKHRIFFNDSFTDSCFTKNQIIHIANGVGEKKITDLVVKLQKKENLNNSQWIFLIQSIENLLEKYGPDLISNILNMSPLPHCIGKVHNIFNVINELSKTIQNPVIRLRNEGAVFILEPLVINNDRFKNILKISKKDQQGKSYLVGHIGSNGHFLKNSEFTSPIIPTLQLILNWNSNMKEAIAYYGVETGECSLCGRKLTDKTSIKIGIGPICRQSMNY
jgi:hypothetical protein